MSRHLMVVPGLDCPCKCKYCFGPHQGSGRMSEETVNAIVQWQKSLGDTNPLQITFHGGEPLAIGSQFFRTALPILRDGLVNLRTRFILQSNLWLLTDELCKTFVDFGVSLGTSLDGPKQINDAQRGRGYYRRTMAGIELARGHGLEVGCICTFTGSSATKASEIYDFFLREGLNFNIHAASPSLQNANSQGWELSNTKYGSLMLYLLDRYLSDLKKIRINTLDAMCRSVSANHGGICTFSNCLGNYLAVAPDGGIYICQRFVGIPDYQIGNVHNRPSLKELEKSPVWQAFRLREERIQEDCRSCTHFNYCRGGCPYNALAVHSKRSPNKVFSHEMRDPHCPAYRRVFNHISDRALAEVFTEENIDFVVNHPDPKGGLLRHGKLLSLMGETPHPFQVASNARQVLAAVALASTGDPVKTADRFQQLGLTSNLPRTLKALKSLYKRLTTPVTDLNNLYLHVTFSCPLNCSHCYADGGKTNKEYFSVTDVKRAILEATVLGFRHAVITGGEPLVHPRCNDLFDMLANLRYEVKPLLTVLRTSLAYPMKTDLVQRISSSTDETVVSVDGDKETHDLRRGKGSYDLTVKNLRTMVKTGLSTNLSLAAVLPLHQVKGKPGKSVLALAQELGIHRTRFRPLLPLGRAASSSLDILQESQLAHLKPREMVAYGFSPTATCGLGQNLYVEPDGSAFPCYACHGQGLNLGKINTKIGLTEIIHSLDFQKLRSQTVNNRQTCQKCELRYLCGGACLAWNRQFINWPNELTTAPIECGSLKTRAHSILTESLNYLGVSTEKWSKSGFPLITTVNRE